MKKWKCYGCTSTSCENCLGMKDGLNRPWCIVQAIDKEEFETELAEKAEKGFEPRFETFQVVSGLYVCLMEKTDWL